jgi:hypothetical protein
VRIPPLFKGTPRAVPDTVGTGLTGEEHPSDQCAMTQSGDFEAEYMCRDRKACVEAKQVWGR